MHFIVNKRSILVKFGRIINLYLNTSVIIENIFPFSNYDRKVQCWLIDILGICC